MKITAIELEKVRGFNRLEKTSLSDKINIFVGRNNSGKSTILKSIMWLQYHALNESDQTIGSKNTGIGYVNLFSDNLSEVINTGSDYRRFSGLRFSLMGQRFFVNKVNGLEPWGSMIPSAEPYNLIYPYLSNRKTSERSEIVNSSVVNSVDGTFKYLNSKIDRLSGPNHEYNSDFVSACKDILDFQVGAFNSANGKTAGYSLRSHEDIPLEKMGEGVSGILGLVVDLCMAKDKIFLIEEPENDIHPEALKSLLNLIIKKSETNQFFVSTHSNVVMRVLGKESSSKVFQVTSGCTDSKNPKLFVSQMKEVLTPGDRIKALEDLGYDLFDAHLYKSFLLLEEPSAEAIIRDFLIPTFCPGLVGKLRTYSAGGYSKIEKSLRNLLDLFVFIHLTPVYENKAWIIIDGGSDEKRVIDKLKEMYVDGNHWDASRFNQFSKHDFEEFYPTEFKEIFVSEIQGMNKNDLERRRKKTELLQRLLGWIDKNPIDAKAAFLQSAKEVIDKLTEIETALKKA